MYTTTNNPSVMTAPVRQPLILRPGYCAILGIFCWLLVAGPSSARAEDRFKLTVETSGAVTLMEGGKRLGCFLPPEIDSPEIPEPETSFKSLSASASTVRNLYIWQDNGKKASLEVLYELQSQNSRVKVSTQVRSGPALQWWLGFEVEDAMDFPRAIAFIQNDKGSYPYQFALPGEGITSWWGIQDYGRLRWAFRMFAPAAAIETADRRAIAFATHQDQSMGLRVHRDGLIEVTRRSPAITTARKEFKSEAVWYIGILGSLSWKQLETEFLNQINPGQDYLKGRTSRGTTTPE